jgi:serine/threonine-protein kinase
MGGSENDEESRALLQARVALFWKVIFFIILLSSGLGSLGAVAEPGIHLVLTLASTANAGVFWQLSARAERSIAFSRRIESGGLFLNATISALLGRYLLLDFARDQSLVASQAIAVADGYVSMLQLAGMAMMCAIRAALIPSSPRRTLIITALFGVPMLATTTLLVPLADGGVGLRSATSLAYPWLPLTTSMIWGFAVITCVVITGVIYGLRAEIREARRLGQYVLQEKLGEGGMGEVYRARHGMMRRPSAIKLLRSDRARELDLRRFEREVQLTARLTHPNTITIFDYGRSADGIFYYVMELLEGATLEQIVALHGAQEPGRVVRILTMACGALNEAHAIGLIHRDIKPANIMLCAQGGEHDVVKMLDFGLVKELEVEADVKLTGARSIVGTPQYMAPETISLPDAADVRSDLYALGAVAYYVLTGSHVFGGQSVVEVLSKHLHQAPEPPSARGAKLPAALEALVLACLNKDPSLRPQSASELRSKLLACGIEPWSSERAHAWWRDHGATFRRTAPASPATVGSTLVVAMRPASA